MAKKDSLGRVVIPEDIIEHCSCFRDYSDGTVIHFGMNDNNQVFACLPHIIANGNYGYLGICTYDKSTHTIIIPENVEIVLGNGEDYFFAEKSYMLYIYKKESTLLSKLLSYPSKIKEGVEEYLKKDDINY